MILKGHLLWNAGQIVSDYLQDHASELVVGKNVLEFGAAGAVPSLTCAILGARKVVATDYPDPDLITNIQYNIDNCSLLPQKHSILSRGFLWGNSTVELIELLDAGTRPYDLLILADILFNHSEHGKLLQSVKETLKREPDAVALVFFTPYRPWLLDKDLHFFEIAKEAGFQVTKVLEHTMDRVMFENDPGDEKLRRTVFGYEMRWA